VNCVPYPTIPASSTSSIDMMFVCKCAACRGANCVTETATACTVLEVSSPSIFAALALGSLVGLLAERSMVSKPGRC